MPDTGLPETTKLETARDFPPEVLRLFDQYVHDVIDRRAFLDGASKFAVGGLGAAALLEALSPKFAAAQKIRPDDERVHGEMVAFPSPKGSGQGRGYLVRPAGKPGAKHGAVLVVHENRGLNPHIEDVARRLAVEGFLVFAPDALAVAGGYPGDEDKGRELFAKLDQTKAREDFAAAAEWLRARPESAGKLGAVGFCWGGGIVNWLAIRLGPELAAGVPFYGMAQELDGVPRIKAEMLFHFAGNDPRINATWPAYEAALKAAHVKFEAHVYPRTEHGFNNDTTPRFDKEAAALAWGRTITFFKRLLA
jgi:carboxymethylenebutenolidase